MKHTTLFLAILMSLTSFCVMAMEPEEKKGRFVEDFNRKIVGLNIGSSESSSETSSESSEEYLPTLPVQWKIDFDTAIKQRNIDALVRMLDLAAENKNMQALIKNYPPAKRAYEVYTNKGANMFMSERELGSTIPVNDFMFCLNALAEKGGNMDFLNKMLMAEMMGMGIQ